MMLPRKRSHSIVEKVFYKSSLTFILNTTVWVTMVDGAVIGNFLGVDAFAAYGLVWPIVLFYGLIGAVFSGGTRTLYSKLAGRGEVEKANKIFTTACVGAVVISIAVIVLSLCFAEQIATLLGASGKNADLNPLVSSYIRGFVFEVPFFTLGSILSSLMVVDSDFKRAAYSRVAMSVFDIAGDLIVVLFLNGGMFLLGFTTAIAQLVYFLVMCTHFFRKNRILRFVVPKPAEWIKLSGDIISHGIPAGLTAASGAVGGVVANKVLSHFTTSTFIAAYSVHKSVGSMIAVAYMCISDSVWTLSGVYYGEEDKNALGEIQRIVVRKALVFNVIVSAVVFVFAKYFAMLYIGKADAEVLSLSTEAVRLMAVSLPLFMFVYSFRSYLMGIGRKGFANVYGVLSECVVHILVIWVMVFLTGGKGAWFATPLKLLIMLAVTVMYILLNKNGGSFREKSLLLGTGFGSQDDKEMTVSVESMEEVVNMSQRAMQFCLDNGIDKAKSNALAHCIEEIGNNIITHGFSASERHGIDMRILIKEKEIILRIRDDCRAFNPVEYYELMQKQNDSPERTGLKIIMGLCSDRQYTSIVGTNNLILHIIYT